jgi:hypothetical protein
MTGADAFHVLYHHGLYHDGTYDECNNPECREAKLDGWGARTDIASYCNHHFKCGCGLVLSE